MEALKSSFIPWLHFPITQARSLNKSKQHLHFHFCSVPTSCFPSYKRHGQIFKVLNTLSSSSSSSSIVLSDPESDIQDEEEKFDWYAQWYPVMPVCDLDKRVPHAKKVMGLDVVLWWDRNEGEGEGAWRVFDDTCPHRLAPLSEGRIDQWGRLQCVYHGWCFNGSGDCKFIPQAPPEGPPVHTFSKACVSVYPSTVQNEIVWFWPNSDPIYEDILSYKKPPYIPELNDPSYAKSMGVRDFPFGYEILIENLMDPAHVPYAHFKLMPNPPSKNRVKLDREGGGPLDINIQKLDIEGFLAGRTGASTEFIAPCIYSSSFTLPSVQRKVADKGNGSVPSGGNLKLVQDPSSSVPQRRGMLLFYCVPVGPGKSRLIYTFPRNFGIWINRIIPRWVFHLQQNLVLDSDLYLLHIEERRIMDVGPSNWQKNCFVPTKSDGQVIAFRKWLRKYSGGQINWEGKFNGELPPTPPKEQLMDRYRSHVVNCSSCSAAYKSLKALEVILQVFSIGSIGIVAATKQSLTSGVARAAIVLVAVLCFAASRWLVHFIYKNFHYHDYNHALL